MSYNLYYLTIGGIVATSFAFIAVVYQYFMTNPQAISALPGWALIASGIIPFIGLLIMIVCRGGNLIGGVVGYLATVVPLGLLIAITITAYDIADITVAIGVTALIAASFATLGFIKPAFFSRIMPICLFGLIIVIVIELVMMILGIYQNQTILDYIVIILFCGFIGYDFYQAAHDEPTLENAFWHACDIYLDLMNVFLRVLNIRGRDR